MISLFVCVNENKIAHCGCVNKYEEVPCRGLCVVTDCNTVLCVRCLLKRYDKPKNNHALLRVFGHFCYYIIKRPFVWAANLLFIFDEPV
mgnify:CR=1 FL=1